MNVENLVLGQQVFQKTPTTIHFNLLYVCSSVLSFVVTVLLILLFNVLNSYFQVSLSLVKIPINVVTKKIVNCFFTHEALRSSYKLV